MGELIGGILGWALIIWAIVELLGYIVGAILDHWFFIVSVIAVIIALLYVASRHNNSDSISTGQKDGSKDSNYRSASYTNQEHKYKKRDQHDNNKYRSTSDVQKIICQHCGSDIFVYSDKKAHICKTCKTIHHIKMSDGGYYIYVIVDNNSSLKCVIPSNESDCLALLGLTKEYDMSKLKSAYKRKMAEYHPDKVYKLGEKLRKVAENESKAINEAYAILRKRLEKGE